MIRSRLFAAALASLTLGLAACGGESNQQPAEETGGGAAAPAETTPNRRVTIIQPADGSTIQGGDVDVLVEAFGFTVVPAGDTTPNSGHHHLFLDRDVSPAGEPIPTEEGYIVHMGTGVSNYTFHGVAPGEHRLIAVVGDAVHVPLEPMVADTVHFTVR